MNTQFGRLAPGLSRKEGASDSLPISSPPRQKVKGEDAPCWAHWRARASWGKAGNPEGRPLGKLLLGLDQL